MKQIMKWTALSVMLMALAGLSTPTSAQQEVSEIDQLVSNGWENYRNSLYREAVLDFRRAVRVDTENVSAAEGLGAAAVQLQDWTNAKTGYEMAHRLAPENCGYAKSLAYVYMAMKLYDRAMMQYEKVSGVAGKPGCDPADNGAKTNLGYLYFRSRKEANEGKALQVLNQVINSGEADEASLIRAHYYLGMLYKKKKNYDLAVKNLETTFELDPARTDGRDVLGQILFNKKEYDKALEHLGFALQSNENNYNLNFMTGIIYTEMGAMHQDDAISFLAKAANLARLAEKRPRNLPHRHLADLYNKTGEPGMAVDVSNEGLSMTDDADEKAGLTCTKASGMGKQGQHSQAINLLEKVLDNPTWGPWAAKELGRQETLLTRKNAQEEN